MRTGAAGVLVGFGGGAASTTRATLGIHAPMATAVADVAGARRDYLDESGGRYVHVIADGGVGTSGDIVKALAMGADAVMLGVALARATDAPGRGYHWGPEAHHSKLPRGRRVSVDQVGHARGGAVRPGAGRRRHREPHRGAAQVDGDDRVLRPQGVPARRGRRRALQRGMTSSDPSTAGTAGEPVAGRADRRPRGASRRRCARSCCGRGGSGCCAALPRRRGRVRLARPVAARPRDRHRPDAAGRHRGGPAARPTSPRRASTCPSRSSASASTVDRHVGARGLPRRRVAVQRRRRGLLGHRPAAARGRATDAPSRSRSRSRSGGRATEDGRAGRGRAARTGCRRAGGRGHPARAHRAAHLRRGSGAAAARRRSADA